MDHWRRGHKQICKKIHRGGNAEQYHADKKYKEAVAEAVEACAEDTKGHTCYICMDAVHSHTGEGLVRGCACRGAAGFAHVSCLARQAQVAVERGITFDRWSTCGLCEQRYHGVVKCALGWAYWKTYLHRPYMDWCLPMNLLSNGLSAAKHYEDALSVVEAELSLAQRVGETEDTLLRMRSNLSNALHKVGRLAEALNTYRDVYSKRLKLSGEEHRETLMAANNLAYLLQDQEQFEEARSLLRKMMPVARRILGDSHDITLGMRSTYAQPLYKVDGATLDDLREAVDALEETERTARRVLGGAHPDTTRIEGSLREVRAALRARETPPTVRARETPPTVRARETPPTDAQEDGDLYEVEDA